ncbi:MAG: phosphopantetheine-binding protein [Methylococcaceae bacterium]|nr:phosphopantetheine-binding protein [Methylococcaceae bacterium]
MENLEVEIKQLIIDTFGLEGMSPEDIDSAAPLFAEGLGLDSIDALELGVALKKKYPIHVVPDSADLVQHFASVNSLIRFIASQQERADP